MPLDEITRVIAFDPGITTGWAKGLIREGRMGVVSGQDKLDHKNIYDVLRLFKPDEIIYERFDYRKVTARGKAGTELMSREYIGVINLYAQQRNNKYVTVNVCPQFPAEALGGFYQSDEALKKEMMYMRGKPHANDAMRHILHWFVFKDGFRYNKAGYYRLDIGEPVKDYLREEV